MSRIKVRVIRITAIFLLINILTQVLFPVGAYALTSGPTQPEFSSFEPVATTNMVNEFTGGFTYNLPVMDVPGPNGGGYAVALSYHSGSSMEEEASWVGYGWTLNPGAINRNKIGIADDQKGAKIIKYNKQPDNWTVSASGSVDFEIASIDFLGISGNVGMSYNNYRGFGIIRGFGVSVCDGLASLDLNMTEQGHSFSANVNPASYFTYKNNKKLKVLKKAIDDEKNEDIKKSLVNANASIQNKKDKAERYKGRINKLGVSQYGMHYLSDDYRASTVTKYTGASISVAYNVKGTPLPFELGGKVGVRGNFTYQSVPDNVTEYGYGYMYQKDGLIADGAYRIMDYNIEKEATFNGRDKYLPIPFQAADNFSVTGEGVMGGFRLHHKNVGHFSPNEVTSHTAMGHLAGEVGVGADLEAPGLIVGLGHHRLSVGKWDAGNLANYSYTGNSATDDEPVFFRFNNDKGGNLIYTDSDAEYQADLKTVSINSDGISFFSPEIKSSAIKTKLDDRTGRASYIGYNTNTEMNNSIQRKSDMGNSIYYNSYTKNSDVRRLVDRSSSSQVKDGIGEFATYNDDGNKFVYGLPVYSSQERILSYSTEGNSSIENKHLMYKDISSDAKSKRIHGEINDNPIANTYLLTEINTTDYIDRTYDGPTNDDFGGWTKFSYRGAYASPDKSTPSPWFSWRSPYTGLNYSKNELSDPRDDMGAYSSGKKEIYYLKTIETKTHIAFFVTNKSTSEDFAFLHEDNISLNDQLDGSDIERTDGIESGDPILAAASKIKGTKTLEKLEKIVLYAKNEDGKLVGKPLKTVHYEYYADGDGNVLCKNLPNSSYTNSGKNGGKLTLKKVWFEYEGVLNSRIAPYVFTYHYKKPTDFSSAIQSKYSDIVNYANFSSSAGFDPENPDYNSFNIDCWGNYRYDGASRWDKMQPWVSQKANDASFDPAAWQLKQIKLPSGGEILIQYEQNDYRYVQDESAMAMVSLKDNAEVSSGFKNEKDEGNYEQIKYYLNLSDLQLPVGFKQSDYVAFINEYLSKNKIYFKFLYNLLLHANTAPDLNKCNVDYITGFANAHAEQDEHGIYIKFGDNKDNYQFPRKVCLDHVKRNKGGEFINEACDEVLPSLTNGGNPKATIMAFFGSLATRVATMVGLDEMACLSMSLNDSYLRIPMMTDKKGGGIRVKRILMFDNGLEAGDESLYGSEYIYKNPDGSTSGVAQNEPGINHEENALVKFLKKRASQNTLKKVISGLDKEEFTGPVGESLLPAPSIGYSRVVIKNIHSGQSNTGFTVNEFYTSKDFPMEVHETEVQKQNPFAIIPAMLVNLQFNNKYVTQGYSFILNEMNGQIKRVASYKGNYSPSVPETNYYSTSEQIFEYYKPGEKVRVMDNAGNIKDDFIGKETEVTMETKFVEDIQNDLSVHFEFNLKVGLFIPFPGGSWAPYFDYAEKKLKSHVITKVIRYPAIQKKVTAVHDGMTQSTTNLIFDSNNGQVIATKTTDEYDGVATSGTVHDGTYINYKVPAAKVYTAMGQKSQNERFVIKYDATDPNGKFLVYTDDIGYKQSYLGQSAAMAYNSFINLQTESKKGAGGREGLPNRENVYISETFRDKIVGAYRQGKLAIGDLILLSDNNGNKAIYYLIEFDDFYYQRMYLQPLSIAKNDYETTMASTFTKLEVIRSGYTNQLNALAGQITTYGKGPLPTLIYIEAKNSNNTQRQVRLQANVLNVVSATMTTYSDNWYNYFMAQDFDDVTYNSLSPKVCETGSRGKWRPKSTFVYKEPVMNYADQPNIKNYSSGVINSSLQFFYFSKDDNPGNYSSGGSNQSAVGEYLNPGSSHEYWVETNRMNVYSPDGNLVEDQNIQGTKSSSRYGYSGKIPVLIAQNAPYSTVQFRSFEDESVGGIVNKEFAHSGSKSGKIGEGTSIEVDKIFVPQTSSSQKVSVKFWVKTDKGFPDDVNSNGLKTSFVYCPLKFGNKAPIESLNSNLNKIARVGNWTLYEAQFNNMFTYNEGGLKGSYYKVKITNVNPVYVWIDDIRVQPLDAQMNAYVYDDKNLRLLASFDDQHFGLFYQYNAEGKLVRKLVETERGLKTVTETQYNVPLKQRNQ